METRKKTYNKPLLQSEAFIPNEYVAACDPESYITDLYLACDGTSGDGRDHNENGCKRNTAYRIGFNKETKLIEYIYEEENDLGWGGGNVTNLTVDGKPASSTPLTDIHKEYELEWRTRIFLVTMYHTGTLKLSTAQKVNMS